MENAELGDELKQSSENKGIEEYDARLFSALEAAAAADVIDSLDAGLDGRLSELGRNLSGGQRQRWPPTPECARAGWTAISGPSCSRWTVVNGLLEHLKNEGQGKFVSLVNAVLRAVGERGSERVEALCRSASLEDRALWAGVPVWSLPAWTKSWKRSELNELFDLMRIPPASSLRVSPGREAALNDLLRKEGLEPEPSDLSGALRLSCSRQCSR